jgi:hypothetical protein
MAFKCVFLAVFFEENPDFFLPSVNDALSLAASEKAYLNVVIGVPRLSVPSAVVIPQVRGMLASANRDRRKSAESLSSSLKAKSGGVAIEIEIFDDAYIAVRNRFVTAAGATDIVVLAQPESAL